MPIPVKTRFGSTVAMILVMLDYRDIVNDCYGSHDSIEIRCRNPDVRIWEAAQMICDTLQPVMHACILSQTRWFWLLSDAIAKVAKLYLKYRDLHHSIGAEETFSEFPAQLKECQRRMCDILRMRLKRTIEPLFQYESLLQGRSHYFLALALNPEYKGLRRPFMKLHAGNAFGALNIVKMYDKEQILPELVHIFDSMRIAQTTGA